MDDVVGIPVAVAYRQFIAGFAYLDRTFRPVSETDRNGILHCHWPNGDRRGSEWSDEFFAWEEDPAAYLDVVRSSEVSPRHFVSDGYVERGPARSFFEANGYVWGDSEPFMALDLAGRTPVSTTHTIVTVTDLRLGREFTDAQIDNDLSLRDTNQVQIDDPAIILKIAMDCDRPVAAGKAVLVDDSIYISDITTLPSHRKQGYAAAIMEALHHDAQTFGARRAILCASEMAANLYRTLGYQDHASVDLYLPATEADLTKPVPV